MSLQAASQCRLAKTGDGRSHCLIVTISDAAVCLPEGQAARNPGHGAKFARQAPRLLCGTFAGDVLSNIRMQFRCSIVVRQEPYRVDEIVSLRSEAAKPWKCEDKMTDIEFELGAPARRSP